jgi:hypothetical protein
MKRGKIDELMSHEVDVRALYSCRRPARQDSHLSSDKSLEQPPR